MQNLINEYLDLQKQAADVSIESEYNWNFYNDIIKKLVSLQDKIIQTWNYEEIFNEIIKQSKWDSYIQLHCDIAWATMSINPEYSKSIYLRYKDEPISRHVLKKKFWIDLYDDSLNI